MANQPAGERRPITPKDVFDRSSMPSRWERMTGVAPKTAQDRLFLSFVAARYLGEKRLPHPSVLAVPDDIGQTQTAGIVAAWACIASVVVGIVGVAAGLGVVVGIGLLGLVVAMVARIAVTSSTSPAMADYLRLKAQCEAAHARLNGEVLDPEYRTALNDMITCDEGALAYCAAKIASEIKCQPGSKAARAELVAVNLWDELAAIGASAREIAEEREETARLERSRLRQDSEIRETIARDKQMRQEALALLTARVYAFADYRDQVHRLGAAAWRDKRIAARAKRFAADELAVKRNG